MLCCAVLSCLVLSSKNFLENICAFCLFVGWRTRVKFQVHWLTGRLLRPGSSRCSAPQRSSQSTSTRSASVCCYANYYSEYATYSQLSDCIRFSSVRGSSCQGDLPVLANPLSTRVRGIVAAMRAQRQPFMKVSLFALISQFIFVFSFLLSVLAD